MPSFTSFGYSVVRQKEFDLQRYQREMCDAVDRYKVKDSLPPPHPEDPIAGHAEWGLCFAHDDPGFRRDFEALWTILKG